MKKFIKPLGVCLLTLILITGCNKKKAEDEEQITITEQRNQDEDNTDDTSKKDCDDFLKEYEKWMDDVVEVIARHKDDPAGLIGDPDYMKSMTEASNWSMDWLQISAACSRDSKYQEKFNAIQNRMEEKMKDLGID